MGGADGATRFRIAERVGDCDGAYNQIVRIAWFEEGAGALICFRLFPGFAEDLADDVFDGGLLYADVADVVATEDFAAGLGDFGARDF